MTMTTDNKSLPFFLSCTELYKLLLSSFGETQPFIVMVPLISNACYPQDVLPFSTLVSQQSSGTLGTVWGLKHISQGSRGPCKSTPLRVFSNSTSSRRAYLFVTMYKVTAESYTQTHFPNDKHLFSETVHSKSSGGREMYS